MQTQIRTSQIPLTVRSMHKYVMLGVGVWMTFVITFAIAYLRVSHSQQYRGKAFQALSPSETQRPASSY